MKFGRNMGLAWLSACALTCAMPAHAQTPPDAGQLRQQIERGLPLTLPQPKLSLPAPPPPMTAMAGKAYVQQFRFAGNSALATPILEAALAGYTRRELDFSQLQEAAARIGQLYREAGYVVRAYLPRQEITAGIVIIQVVEAHFGAVRIEAAPGLRVSEERLRRTVLAQQTPGQLVRADPLERALLLLAELPGAQVSGSLQEGREQGQSDVILTATAAPLFSGDASIDNTGSRSTGALRAAANLSLNSPFGLADQAGLNLAHTEGSDFARAAYSVPLGFAAWRLGANASLMRYRLVSSDFAALQARGDSHSYGMDLNYPLLRTRQGNATVTASLERKDFNNLSGGFVSTRYKLGLWSLGVAGSAIDASGAWSGSATLGGGNVNLDGSPNQAADAATTRTEGRFAKLRFSLSRNQTLNQAWSLQTALSAQRANKNLDSGEKFYLGGATGVRAYPASEAGGADGAMMNLELRYKPRADLTASAHVDAGQVQVNHDNDFTGAAAKNNLNLRGAGLGLAWNHASGVSVKALWSRRIGSNPNPTAAGRDQDGSLVRNRVWLTASITL